MPKYIKVVHSSEKDKWLEERKKSVGASDPLDNTSAKRKAGLSAPFVGNVHTEAGTNLECAILDWWARDYGHKAVPFDNDAIEVEECGWLLRNPEFPLLHATPDGWAEGVFVVEIKNVGLNKAGEWLKIPPLTTTTKDPLQVVTKYQQIMLSAEVAEQPPKTYWSQVQHQLFVTGLSYGYLVGLIGGKRLVEHRIERDEEFIAERVKKCHAFMAEVEKLKENKDGSDK